MANECADIGDSKHSMARAFIYSMLMCANTTYVFRNDIADGSGGGYIVLFVLKTI